ncbi:hypothetical protein D3C87_911700 [compost metagenome]
MSKRSRIKSAMRRATCSKPLGLMALRLAASISACMARTTSSRTWKPSATGCASAVLRYIDAMIWLCRASRACRATPASAMLAALASSPRSTMGSWSVKAMGDTSASGPAPSTPASRLRKPER